MSSKRRITIKNTKPAWKLFVECEAAQATYSYLRVRITQLKPCDDTINHIQAQGSKTDSDIDLPFMRPIATHRIASIKKV